MSMYCSVQDVIEHFPGNQSWGQGTAPSEARIEEIIAENSALIDDMLRDRYQVPFDPVPALIKKICTLLSVADVRDILFGVAAQPDSQADLRRKTAMSLLEKLASGALQLGSQRLPGSPEGESPGPPAASDTGEPIFSRNRTW